MKIRRPRRKQPPQADQRASAAEGWTYGKHLIGRGLAGLLWLAVATGPVALVLVITMPPRSAPAAPTVAVTDRSGEVVAAGEFAERFVTTWLAATRGAEAALSPFIAEWRDVRLPTEATVAANPSASAVEDLGDGVWSVTVGVDLTEPATRPGEGDATNARADDVELMTVRRFFQVPVLLTSSGAVTAQSLPAPVPPPPVADPQPTVYRYDLPRTAEASAAASEFLSALLTSAGGLDRYTTPGSAIVPIEPAPYVEVVVRAVRADQQPARDTAPADGEQLRVLAAATVTTAAGHEMQVTYPLTLRARGGRWEVEAIDPAPAVTGAGTAPSGAAPTSSDAPADSPGTPVPQPEGN